jgi:hypothetical protein
MEIKKEVEVATSERFPGSELVWEDDPALTRPGGTLVWGGFAQISQIDRQREIGRLLRERLGPRAVELGSIFALTPEERSAIRESSLAA